jgi:hypothetical protein
MIGATGEGVRTVRTDALLQCQSRAMAVETRGRHKGAKRRAVGVSDFPLAPSRAERTGIPAWAGICGSRGHAHPSALIGLSADAAMSRSPAPVRRSWL